MFWVVLALQALPDSAARAQVDSRLQMVAESLSALRGAAAHFRLDLAKASDALIVARAKRVRASCASAIAATDSLDAPLARGRFTARRGDADPRALRSELGTLRRALVQCRGEWDADRRRTPPDSLRAWGPFRLTALEGVMRRYEQRATRFRGYVAPPETDSTR
jgi:hypothetical protein